MAVQLKRTSATPASTIAAPSRPPLNSHKGIGPVRYTRGRLMRLTTSSPAVPLFSCLTGDASAARNGTGTTGGTWVANAEAVLGPYDLAGAKLLADSRLYVGRPVQLRDGGWRFVAFDNVLPDGTFGGTITDPRPVSLVDGDLVLG